MKLKDIITEMPEDIGTDMHVPEIDKDLQVLNVEFVRKNFQVLRRLNENGQSMWYVLKEDNSLALAGRIQGQSFITQIVLYFHDTPDLGEAGSNALQVDLVQGAPSMQSAGMGSRLYISIINADKTIVSDSAQYNGGKALWKKIVRLSMDQGYFVYIMRDGKFMRDDQDQPIKYNGKNIPNYEIWGGTERSDTLLVARK